MIERIVDFALKQRMVVLVSTLVLVVLGANAFRNLPIEAYPDVADTWVQIITQWPGHAAEEMERQITIPTERVMNGVPRKSAIRSTSIAGLSVVTLIFEDRTDSYFARQQVLERLSQIDLPEGVTPMLGPLASPVGEILRYRLVSCAQTDAPECEAEDREVPPRSLSELKELQEWVVERRLLATPGVADVVSFGGTIKQYQVLVSPALLAARSLTIFDVERAIESANESAGGGVVTLGAQSLNVRGLGLLRPEQIADVTITTHEGTPVRIRDVASVQVGHQPRLGRVSIDDDADVVAATILLRKGEQAETVLAQVHARIDDINARVLPRGVKLSPHHDRTELMQQTTHTVLENLVVGIGLVTLVLFVFLGNARAALIVAVTIPVSLLIAFIFMDYASIPANLLSIGALDFGMIVDGSIVMVENVFRLVSERQSRGEKFSLSEVVRSAAREVARPIVFAIGIIITAYLPIFTLERVEGKLFSPMAWTVSFALIGALVLAITIVPVLASFLFRARLREYHNPILERVRAAYLPALRRALARPRAVFVFAALVLALDLGMASAIGTEFLPHLDEGSIWMRATMPASISFAEATRLVDGVHEGEHQIDGIREILARFPEVRRVSTQLGRPDDGTDPTGFYNAEFLMLLEDRRAWRPSLRGDKDALIAEIERAVGVIPGIILGFSQPISDNVEEAVTGVKGQLAVKIAGDDLNALDDMAEQVARAIRDVPGVVDLGIFRELGQSNLHIELRRDRLERYGLTVAEVDRAIETGIGGSTITQIVEGERRHDVVVRYAETERDNVDAIRRLLIPLEDGRTVPLGQVAEVSVVAGASKIYRENNRRYIAVKFGVRDRDLGGTVAEAQARVASEVRFAPGYEVSWGGEFESAQRAARRLALVVPATIALVFVMLFGMFGRPREPLLILANVLLTSLVGGLAALLFTGTSFSVSAGVGFLALFGVSVQTGVILIAYVNELRLAGKPLDEAIREAADRRLRPIMMTALVATLGLLPAAVSTGIGSDSQKPLAIVVVGGLVSSLALSLFVLPMLYRLYPPKLGAAALALLCALGAWHGAPSETQAQRVVDAPTRRAERAIDPPSTQDEVLAVWLRHGREIDVLRAEVGEARFELVSASLWPNPEIQAGFSATPFGPPPDGRRNFTPVVVVPIPIGQVAARRGEARENLRVAELAMLVALWERHAELTRAMVERAFADATMTMLRTNVEELARILTIVETRASLGANPTYDALRVRTARGTFEAALAEAGAARNRAEAHLLSLMAVPGLESAPVTREGLASFRGPADEATSITLALGTRPDLRLAQQGVTAAEASAHRYRRENRPTPALTLGTLHTWEPRSTTIIVGAQTELPIFDRNQGQIGRANARAEGQRALGATIEERIRAEVRGAFRARASAREALETFREGTLRATEELRTRAEYSYQRGAFTVLDLLDAYRAVWEAREQALELERAFAEAEAELERAIALTPLAR